MRPEDHVKPLKAILDLKNRYERVHGQIGEEALTALIGFSAYQFRNAVRTIAIKAPENQKSQLLQDVLDVFQSIHRRNYFYVMKACYKEKGLSYCFHITKRIIKAKSIISKYRTTRKYALNNRSHNKA